MKLFNGFRDTDGSLNSLREALEEEERKEAVENRWINAYPRLWELMNVAMEREGIRQSQAGRDEFNNLMDRYAESHRRHHTADHIDDMASQFFHYADQITKRDHPAFAAAILYHDVVYDCKHGVDEAESAKFSASGLQRLRVPKPVIDRSTELISATATHKAAAEDFTVALFLDIDMSVLAARPDFYARYVENVRYEYCSKLNLTAESFNAARAERFLKPTLAGGKIFATDIYAELEPLARANLRRELQSYEASPR